MCIHICFTFEGPADGSDDGYCSLAEITAEQPVFHIVQSISNTPSIMVGVSNQNDARTSARGQFSRPLLSKERHGRSQLLVSIPHFERPGSHQYLMLDRRLTGIATTHFMVQQME